MAAFASPDAGAGLDGSVLSSLSLVDAACALPVLAVSPANGVDAEPATEPSARDAGGDTWRDDDSDSV